MNVLRHRFSSPRLDGPDSGQIQPSHWNDGHAFTGGNPGDVLTRDPTDATYGAIWRSGGSQTINYDGSTSAITAPTNVPIIQIFSQAAADVALHGVTPASGTFALGTILRITQWSTGVVTLYHSSSSVAVGRFLNVATASTATRLRGIAGSGAIGGSAEYFWNGGYWLMSSHQQGGPIVLGFTAANFSGFTANQAISYYYLHGRDAHIHVYVDGSFPAATGAFTVTGFPWAFYDVGGYYRLVASAAVNAYAGWGANLVRISGTSSALDIVAQSGAFSGAGHQFLIDSQFPIF